MHILHAHCATSAEMTDLQTTNCVSPDRCLLLLLIATGCHLCHPAHVPVHLDNKKDQ